MRLGYDITKQEIETVIKILKLKKSAGYDKIADETFILNSRWIGNILGHIFKTMKYTGKLPNERVRGIGTFIFKKNDKRDLNNYRPITITAIVYKIWATVLTNRLKPYTDFITNEFENAYKVGRST